MGTMLRKAVQESPDQMSEADVKFDHCVLSECTAGDSFHHRLANKRCS